MGRKPAEACSLPAHAAHRLSGWLCYVLNIQTRGVHSNSQAAAWRGKTAAVAVSVNPLCFPAARTPKGQAPLWASDQESQGFIVQLQHCTQVQREPGHLTARAQSSPDPHLLCPSSPLHLCPNELFAKRSPWMTCFCSANDYLQSPTQNLSLQAGKKCPHTRP